MAEKKENLIKKEKSTVTKKEKKPVTTKRELKKQPVNENILETNEENKEKSNWFNGKNW